MKCQAKGLLIWCNYSGIKACLLSVLLQDSDPISADLLSDFSFPTRRKMIEIICCAAPTWSEPYWQNWTLILSFFTQDLKGCQWLWADGEVVQNTKPSSLSHDRWRAAFNGSSGSELNRKKNSWNIFSFSRVKATCLNAIFGGFCVKDHPNIIHNSG